MAKDNKNIIYLPLEDVESEHCALIVEKGLAQVKGVESHKVEVNNRRAVISVSSNEAVSKAVKAVKDLGYGVTTIKGTFPVLEMTCASCAGSVESIVQNQEGVVNASVNFGTANLTVEKTNNKGYEFQNQIFKYRGYCHGTFHRMQSKHESDNATSNSPKGRPRTE